MQQPTNRRLRAKLAIALLLASAEAAMRRICPVSSPWSCPSLRAGRATLPAASSRKA